MSAKKWGIQLHHALSVSLNIKPNIDESINTNSKSYATTAKAPAL